MKTILIILCLTLGFSAKATEKQIVMSSFAPPEASLYTRLFDRIYTEALRRLGYTFKFKIVPPVRASVEANQGITDGEPGRLFEHSDRYTNLIRIPESLVTVTFAAYATRADIKVDGWESIRKAGYQVDVMRGLSFIKESGLDPKNISDLNDRSQAYPRLLSGRADVYVDVAFDFYPLMRSPQYKNATIHEVCVLSRREAYGFLHKKHKDLVPRLAEVLRDMKKEGRIEQLEREVQEESISHQKAPTAP